MGSCIIDERFKQLQQSASKKEAYVNYLLSLAFLVYEV